MTGTGRGTMETPSQDLSYRQINDDARRETRRSLMVVVAKATDVCVKRAPVAHRGVGSLPGTRLEYHEKVGRRRD
jgi:hypothetical protein